MSALSNPGRRLQVATDFRLNGRSERLVGQNGEINASTIPEALQVIASMMKAQQGPNGVKLVTEAQYDEATAAATSLKENREAVMAAFQSDEAHAELGAILTDTIYRAANKQGFARKLLKRQELQQGMLPQAIMSKQNVTAVVATAPVQCHTQLLRNNRYFPQEFYVLARPFIEQREIDQTNVDILATKYLEALEGIMVQEDRTWRQMAFQTVGVVNQPTDIVGDLTPGGLSQVRTQLTSNRIGATNLVMAADLWDDFIGGQQFMSGVDPVTRHEIILTGELGKLLGMTITTDAFRHENHWVLQQGEFWVVSDPDYHGQFTDRGGVSSEPIGMGVEKTPGRGWAMSESISMVIANAASIAYGRRLK